MGQFLARPTLRTSLLLRFRIAQIRPLPALCGCRYLDKCTLCNLFLSSSSYLSFIRCKNSVFFYKKNGFFIGNNYNSINFAYIWLYMHKEFYPRKYAKKRAPNRSLTLVFMNDGMITSCRPFRRPALQGEQALLMASRPIHTQLSGASKR